MCLAIPGQVVALPTTESDVAHVQIGDAQYPAKLGLLAGDPLALGEWVLVYAGYVYAKIDEDEARAVLELIAGMDQVLDEFGVPTALPPETADWPFPAREPASAP
jgi:hydrogenase expression/formation protein HypC